MAPKKGPPDPRLIGVLAERGDRARIQRRRFRFEEDLTYVVPDEEVPQLVVSSSDDEAFDQGYELSSSDGSEIDAATLAARVFDDPW